MSADLFVDVDGVERPLVALQADGRSRHRLVVLGTDDDDDQVIFLRKGRTQPPLFIQVLPGRKALFVLLAEARGIWRVYLAEVALHEVDLAYAPDVLLKNIDLK